MNIHLNDHIPAM